jgi:hypothetical protein
MRCPLVYEINTRCWLAELSEKLGRRLTLADIPEEQFALWQHRGFTHIWLMGVWTIGARGRDWSRQQLGTGFNPCVRRHRRLGLRGAGLSRFAKTRRRCGTEKIPEGTRATRPSTDS